MPNIVALIPARGGSKGIPRKNIRFLNGKPLIVYSINVAKKAKLINRTIISTDDEEIADIAKQNGAEVIMRPAELATDTATQESVLLHTIDYLKEKENYQTDAIVLLQPTCPLRSPKDIDGAVDTLLKRKADTVVSVFEDYYYSWFGEIGDDGTFQPQYDFMARMNRQKLKPKYHEIGSIYIMTPEHLRSTGCRMGGKMYAYIIDKKKALDIDEEFDFWLIDNMLSQNKVNLE